MQTESFALVTDGHVLTAVFEPGYGASEWSYDDRSVSVGASGVELVRDRREMALFAEHLHEEGGIERLSHLAARYPFPALLTSLARLGVAFSSQLLRALDDARRTGHYSSYRTRGSSSTGDGSGGSCTDDYWCAPEFRSCDDCSETTDVFDPPDLGGGGGGGLTPGDPAACERKYRLRLRDCRIDKFACTQYEDEPIDDVGEAIPPPDPPSGPFASVPLEQTDRLRAALDYDRCYRQYEICVDQALWRFERCLSIGDL